ncbi:MAG: zinc ABC transporter substrate-binding protein [Clostridia bacterium]|nr:zinc ABC transporter substrate-binding protein [Clostridia bacterium]
MKRLLCCFLGALIFCTLLTGCGLDDKSGKISVVATLFPQYDFARQIGGDKIDLTLILPPGTESHEFEPTANDILKIDSAGLFIYTGDNMEPWAKKLLSSGEIEGRVLNLSEGIHADSDPHIWTDPQNAIIMVKSIAAALSEIDKENSDYYSENAEKYIKELQKLDGDFEETISGAPQKEMVFASVFPLHYFEKRYGTSHMAAFDSCEEEAEPSAKIMTDIINHVKENNIKYIWCIELENTKTAETITAETGAECLLFHSCHNVTKDDFDAGVTYLSLMNNNLENLKKGLYNA